MEKERQLVFSEGVFPTDITAHLARMRMHTISAASSSSSSSSPSLPRPRHGEEEEDAKEEEDKEEVEEVVVVAIVAANQQLHALPAELPYLPSLARHLRKLDLSFNRLKRLPAAFACLVHLEHLNLSHNLFQEVPDVLMTPAMSDAGALAPGLTPTMAGSLRHLSMSGNRLASLPDAFGRQCSKLESLFLNENMFTVVPTAVYDLNTLLALSLSRNSMTALADDTPDEPNRSLKRMARLRTLDLSHNAFATLALELPASLTSLDLSVNTALSSLSLGQSYGSSAGKLKLKRLDIRKCSLSALPPNLVYFNRLIQLRLAGNPWDDDHQFMRSNPLPLAVLTWLRIRHPYNIDVRDRFNIPYNALEVGDEVERNSCFSLRNCKMLTDGGEYSMKCYAEGTSAESIAHEISIIERLYAKQGELSPLVGIWRRSPDSRPSLVLRKSTGTLRIHLQQQLSLQERAQLAYQVAEALDAIVNDIDNEDELGVGRDLFKALLYHDIQNSNQWMLLDDGRLLLTGSTVPDKASHKSVLCPEMRRQERRHQQQKERRNRQQRDALAMLEALTAEIDDEEYGFTVDEEENWRWGVVPLKGPFTDSQLVFALGVLLFEIFIGESPMAPIQESQQRSGVSAELKKKTPIVMPLAIRQLLQWTWEWEAETEKEAKRRRAREARQSDQVHEQWKRGERRPKLQDIIWICFWLGHDRTGLSVGASDNDVTIHALSLTEFGPQFLSAVEAENEDEQLDEETRQSLMNLFEETRQSVTKKAATMRSFRREQKREQYWSLSRGSDLVDSSDEDDEDDSEGEEGRVVAGGAGLPQLQSLLANITNSVHALSRK